MASNEEIASYLIRGLHNEWIPRAMERIEGRLGITFRPQENISLDINLVDRPNEKWIVGTGSAYAGHSMAVNINTAQVGDLDISSASGWSRGGTNPIDKNLTFVLAYEALNVKGGGSLLGLDSWFPEGLAELTVDGYPADLRKLDIGSFNALAALSGSAAPGVGYALVRAIMHNSSAWGKTPQQTLNDMIGAYTQNRDAYDKIDKAISAATNGVLKNYSDGMSAMHGLWDNFTAKYKPVWGDFLNYACGISLSYTEQHVDDIIQESSNPSTWTKLPGNDVSFTNKSKSSMVVVHYPSSFAKLSETELNHDGRYIGGNYDDTITGGSGESSLWGGAGGNDVLSGRSDGRSEYFYLAGNGRDTVQGANWGAGRDRLYLDFSRGFGYSVDGTNVTLKFGSDSDTLTLQSVGSQTVDFTTDNCSFRHAKFAKAGSTMAFENDVDVFLASGSSTLKVSGNGSQVWADGSHGKLYDGFTKLDGSGAGTVLIAGRGDVNETIVGGTADSSLWGGAGSSDDTLRAGTGNDALYYGYGEGNDIMQNTSANDKVVLYNMNLSEIADASIDSTGVRVTTKAHQTLVVQGDARFALADGSTWRANHSTRQWMQAE